MPQFPPSRASHTPLPTPIAARPSPPRGQSLSHLSTKVLVGSFLVVFLILTGCAGSDTPDTEVLGVSVVSTSIGTTRISVLGSDVNVALLEADTPSTIALARDGEIVTMSDLAPGTDLNLEVDEPGTYDVLGIEVESAEMSADSSDVELAPAQTVTRLGTVEID